MSPPNPNLGSYLCWHAEGHLQVICGHSPSGLLVRQRHRHTQDLLLVASHEGDRSMSKCGVSNVEKFYEKSSHLDIIVVHCFLFGLITEACKWTLIHF